MRPAKWVAVAVLGGLAACSQVEPWGESNARATDPGPRGDGGLISIPLGCADVFVAEPPAISVEFVKAPAACVDHLTHSIRSMMDYCEDGPWTLTGCELPFGASFCRDSQWTVLCSKDGDCPDGMRCTWGEGVGTVDLANWFYGWCAKSCTGAADAECIRCDMRCDKDLTVCLKIPPAEDDSTSAADPEAAP